MPLIIAIDIIYGVKNILLNKGFPVNPYVINKSCINIEKPQYILLLLSFCFKTIEAFLKDINNEEIIATIYVINPSIPVSDNNCKYILCGLSPNKKFT